MYHSVYETFYLVDKIMDRGFKVNHYVTLVYYSIQISSANLFQMSLLQLLIIDKHT